MSNSNSGTSLLSEIRRDARANQGGAAGAQAAQQNPLTSVEGGRGQAQKPPSDFWLNIGVYVTNDAGEEVFIGLPRGIALDDMQPEKVRGSNQNMVELTQGKNALLEALKMEAATLAPGQRVDVSKLSVQLYRRAEPAQTAAPGEGNSLVTALFAVLQGGK